MCVYCVTVSSTSEQELCTVISCKYTKPLLWNVYNKIQKHYCLTMECACNTMSQIETIYFRTKIINIFATFKGHSYVMLLQQLTVP